jgi:acetyltransferase-like isoleucine patch superfamily enzyme
MKKYIYGFFLNIFKKGISFFSLIDTKTKINKYVKINRGVKLLQCEINSYTYIGPNTLIANTHIGKYCSIAPNCCIGLANHSTNYISTSPIFTSKNNGTGIIWTQNNYFEEIGKVTIGNDVWIGMNVLIKSGVEINDGAVIGAGSIVTKDVPPYGIVVGSPAKIIKFRFTEDIIRKLLEIKWWNLSPKLLINHINFFQRSNIKLSDLVNFQDIIENDKK